MNKTVITIALLVGTFVHVLLSEDRKPVEHVILISVDGFNPQWYQDETWPAPFLQQKAKEGAYAVRAQPPFPSLTRPGHVTLLTGWLPARHGVYHNNMPYRLDDGASIFHAVKAAGGSTASVIWPGSGSAPIDHNVRRLGFVDFAEASVELSSDDLLSASDGNDSPGHSKHYERYITGTLRDAQMMAAGVTFIERHKPTFLTLRFNDTDAMQHRFGRDGAAVRGIVASTDMGLTEIAAAVERAGIEDRTVVIVTGDHGMDDVENMLRPNVWLREAGHDPDGELHFEAYGGSAFLYGPEDADVESVQQMLRDLPSEERSGFMLFDRDRLAELGADPRALLGLSASESYAFDGRWEGDGNFSAYSGRHGSHATPDAPNNYTGFVAWGAGIEPGTVLDEVRLVDVAPTVTDLLQVEFGERDGASLVPQLTGQR